MKIKIDQTVQTLNGPARFVGELTADEVNMIMEVGFSYLLQEGVLSFEQNGIKEEDDDLENKTVN